VLEPTQIRVELVARHEPWSDPAGDRLEFAVTNECANVILGAPELGGNLPDRQGGRPLHARSMACGGSTWRSSTTADFPGVSGLEPLAPGTGGG
jgi:hypothetical protein